MQLAHIFILILYLALALSVFVLNLKIRDLDNRITSYESLLMDTMQKTKEISNVNNEIIKSAKEITELNERLISRLKGLESSDDGK